MLIISRSQWNYINGIGIVNVNAGETWQLQFSDCRGKLKLKK